ncbi:MAG: type II toxin-antitoxin system VapC family toxin, partial [Deltaproteobacteria bacterium]|nr:type II toxin-antitoxin system VapC family toxin [Deltaproteobacteria bacterium]
MARRWAYFDTSVLVKRYLNEPGSILARGLLRGHRFVSCVLIPLEAYSTFARLKAAGELNDRNFAAILARVGTDRRQWQLVELHPPILARAQEVVERTQVRTLDALHIASALAFEERSREVLPFV